MNIGILSIHSAHNYGSVLQAYALQEELKKYGQKIEIINYRPYYFEYQYKIFSIHVYNRYPGLFNKFIHFAWRTTMIFDRYNKYQKFEKFINNRLNLTKKYPNYEMLEKETKFNYDIIFCGSDQIWNTNITNGFDKSFYLNFVKSPCIKAIYGASIGYNTMDSKYQKEYSKYLSNLDYISVREPSIKNEIKKYTNKPISVVIDPTLLHDEKMWNKLAINSKLNITYKYILVYILEENKEINKIVNRISKYLNLKIISISKKRRFKNEKIYSSAGPEDFLYLFKNAEFVITNSFHGTSFSIIYKKRNCIIPHQDKGSRMCDLMSLLGLENRIVENFKDLNLEQIAKNIDYKKVDNIINKERKAAEEFIKKACEDGKTN